MPKLNYERYISFALILIVYMGVLYAPISMLSNVILNVIKFIPKVIFGY